jgi:predicted ATPase
VESARPGSALAGARAYGALLADGAAFVALDEARTPDDVCRLVLAALDLPEEAGGAPLPTLVRHVRERELLLVLDNFEQALDAAPVVSELLRAAPGLRALVTSRERLRVYGERVYRVPPLEVADDDVQARRSPAVALFHLRAADTGAEDLVPTEEGERAVAELCRRLDGLPLAIELAAARSDAYSPVELLAQLDRRLDLLTDGPRDLPARQRTLRGAIDWSVHLLSPTEQLVLARLGVFAGGWTTDAAVAVCGDDRVSADAVRAALARLQEASLVHRRDGDRAALYESIRAYGLECLAAAGESDATRARHATWAADLVVSARARLWSAEYAAQLAVVERELANVRAALSWSLEHDVVTAAQLAAGLWLFWNGNGHVGEGRDWLERTIAAADERVPPALRAAMRDGAGVVATIQGDVSAAVAHLEAGLELCAAIPDADPLQIASLHSNLAHVLDQRGSYSEARQHFERGLELRRAVDDTRGVAASIGNLGDMLRRMGELDAAEVALRESLEMNRGIGNVVNAAIALANLAELQVLAGSPEARKSAAAALAQAREFDDPDLEAQCLQVLGMDAADSGDLSRAADLLTQSLVLRADLGELDAVALTTEELARVATLPADHELPHEAALRAAVLYGAAEAVRARCNVPLPPVLVERHSECAERARRVLDDLAYAAQRARGAALPLDRLVQYAAASPSDS